MTGSEKINKVLLHLKLNANQFAKALELGRTQGLYDILDGTIEISKKMANKIAAKFPEINSVWLLTGEGEMLVKKTYDKNDKTTYTEDEDKGWMKSDPTGMIEYLKKHIQSLENDKASLIEDKAYFKKIHEEKIKSLEISLEKVLSNQDELTMQIRAGLYYISDHFAGPDPKKKEKEKERIDTLISSGRK